MSCQGLNADAVKLITFDCYGTLIDWESGIRVVLKQQLELSGLEWQDSYFGIYLECEGKHQCQTYRPYREILTAVEMEVLTQAGASPLPEPKLADSVQNWQPFDDTVEALKRLKEPYKLGVLSNIDRDMFQLTSRQLGVRLDLVVTAEDVEYYKPGPAHFDKMLEMSRLDKHHVLHVAQSLYHDIIPCRELNIPCVWINRRGEKRPQSLDPIAEFADLASFTDALLQPRQPSVAKA